jgi:hypothetical protein
VKAVTINVTTGSEGLIEGLKEAIDRDEVIDIKVPGGIFTVQLESMEVDE